MVSGKVFLRVGPGHRESEDAWRGFLHDMTRQGLKSPLLVVTDGNLGVMKVVEEVFLFAVDVAVQPSHSDIVGGAVESLLAGVPTVATAVGGLPDVIEPGCAGFLTPPKSPATLAAAIECLLSARSRARAMATAGRQKVWLMFGVRQTAAQIRHIYARIVQESV